MNSPSDAPNEPAPPPSSGPRSARVWRPYFETWLLSTLLVFALSVTWNVGELAQKKPDAGDSLAGLIGAPLLALLALPALWLLRIFREASPSSWLRFVRRLLLGTICGLAPAALLAALCARRGEKGVAFAGVGLTCGLCFGLIAGLVDSMHLDASRDWRDDELGS